MLTRSSYYQHLSSNDVNTDTAFQNYPHNLPKQHILLEAYFFTFLILLQKLSRRKLTKLYYLIYGYVLQMKH